MVESSELIPDPSKAELAAMVVSRSGGVFTKGELVPTSVRIPIWVMARLDAMATRSGRSRNHVLNLAIDAGIEAMDAHLPEDVKVEIEHLKNDALSLLSGGGMSGEV